MPYMTNKTGSSIVRLLIIGMFVQLFVVGYVFYQTYQGRTSLAHSQQRGCERGKKDRNANAQGWRIAEGARRANGQTEIADHYARIAAGLEQRSRIDCAKAYPKASFLP